MKIAIVCLALLAAVQAAPSDWSNFADLPEILPTVTPIAGAGAGRSLGSRIVGGVYAQAGDVPYQASLLIDSRSLCGGSLIAPSWVLTAAHCATSSSRVQVILGGISRDLSAAEEGRVVAFSKRVIPHENYNGNTLRNDILLIELEEPVELSDTIQLSNLATDNSISYAGVEGRVSGYGKTTATSAASTLLKYVYVKVLSNAECAKFYGSTIYDGSICTQEIDPDIIGNSCNGDSGGPLVDVQSGQQIGIVSFGSSNGCESGDPKGLTRVTYFIDWIRKTSGLEL